jgi:hypothetical protein
VKIVSAGSARSAIFFAVSPADNTGNTLFKTGNLNYLEYAFEENAVPKIILP